VVVVARALAEELRKLGVGSIYLGVKPRRSVRSLLQWVGVMMLLGRLCVVPSSRCGSLVVEEESIRIVRGRGDYCTDYAVVKSTECKLAEALLGKIPKTPRVVIDLAQWNEHTPGEKRELVEQVVLAIGSVRNYLWDGNFVITHVNEEFRELLKSQARGMRMKVVMHEGFPLELAEGAILLDPEAEQDLTPDVLRSVDHVIIGGIVDKERTAKGATTRLWRQLGLDRLGVPRYRISLRGSVVGVPDRINKIVEIVMSVLYDGLRLEDAIVRAQSKRDKIMRLVWELPKIAERRKACGRTVLAVGRNAFERFSWLGITEEEFRKAVRKANLLLLDQ